MPATLPLNTEQKEVFKAIQKFLGHPAADTFILKGYAGTGKTFLMQHLANWLTENERGFTLLASTGRAATVLRGKTGFSAKTVHGELYHFSKVNGIDETLAHDAPIDKHGQMTLQFTLRQPDNKNQVYIVDEASMLSSEMTADDYFASFGSGLLLTDLFEAIGNNKIIFVGDPCQLPPVKQNISPALDMDWLAQQRRTAIAMTLTKIERTKADNDILKLAQAIRDMSLETILPKYPKLPARNKNNITLYRSNEFLFNKYLETFKAVGSEGTLAIARSNKKVQEINTAMREALYHESDKPLQIGEVLLVIQNNYAVPLTNGDFVMVRELGETKIQAGLYFQHIKVKATASGTEFELLISLDILYKKQTNFSAEQTKALMVDFHKRMRNKDIKANTRKYKEAMMEDEYLNCLRATYGYAVTCHKSQGGEWNEVFLFLESSMYSMPGPELCRWWYTAVTRAKKELNLVNEWWIV